MAHRSLPPPRKDLAGTIAWHYTVGSRFLRIVEDRVIRTARKYITPGERAAVWFTLRNVWEETANKSFSSATGPPMHGDREQTRVKGGGLIRFGIDAGRTHDWRTYLACSGVDPELARGMLAVALERGSNPERDWLVHFGDVPRAMWLAVQSDEGGIWVDVPVDDGDMNGS
jgi:hypothetical protein